MLGQRILTAIVLFIVLGLVLAAPGLWPLPALLGLAAVCALWEWQRLVWPSSASRRVGPVLLALLVGITIAGLLWSMPNQGIIHPDYHFLHTLLNAFVALCMHGIVVSSALFWVLGATTMVVRGNTQAAPGSFVLAAVGVLVTIAAWWSLFRLYIRFDAWLLVSLMAVVWVADIGAYIAGKTLGKHKLAPKVSPGKSIEGALGGVLAAVLWVWLSSYCWDGSFGEVMAKRWSWPLTLLLTAGLAAISIIGDLFESLLKRRAGVKDSSALLPGHGGVYDRIDALLPVSVLAWLLLGGL